jgi:hypothetical protein
MRATVRLSCSSVMLFTEDTWHVTRDTCALCCGWNVTWRGYRLEIKSGTWFDLELNLHIKRRELIIQPTRLSLLHFTFIYLLSASPRVSLISVRLESYKIMNFPTCLFIIPYIHLLYVVFYYTIHPFTLCSSHQFSTYAYNKLHKQC